MRELHFPMKNYRASLALFFFLAVTEFILGEFKVNPNANKLVKSDETKAHYGAFPAEFFYWKATCFLIYTNIIEYQYVGDTKAPLLRVIDSKQRLKNGSVCKIGPTHRIVFTNLDYKELLTNRIGSFSIELQTETGQLVPFSGTGKVVLILQFKKFSQSHRFLLC